MTVALITMVLIKYFLLKENDIFSRKTNHSSEYRLGGVVIQYERKLPIDVSHNMVSRIRTSVPQGSVSLYYNANFISCLCQPILLLQGSYVLNMPLEQAENVIHDREKPSVAITIKTISEITGILDTHKVCNSRS